MAYSTPFQNTYNPQVYQPYYPQMQPVIPSAPVQPVQQPQQTNGIIWVQGEAGAKSYLVAPNTTVQLWDSESQTIYLKSADASGMPTIKTIDYVIREQNSQVAHQTPQILEDKPDYITKADFDEFANNIQRQLNKLSNKNRKYEED